MAKKILVIGKGFIGSQIQKSLNCKISSKWIRSFKDADSEIKKYKPDIIINCIGYTGKNNVDDCEKNQEMTLQANIFVPIYLAEAAYRNKAKLIHISSGCIFHYDYKKDKPITEKKAPDFFNLFYSRSKIYAEGALKPTIKENNTLIIRIRIPLDSKPHPKNLLTKLIKFNNIINVPNSITYIPDFLKALKHLIKIDAKGIYNITNKGTLRYPELLDVYKKYNKKLKYKIISLKKLNLVRTNLILSTKKLEKSGFKIRSVKEILEECVKNYLNY